jgi:hypothetical protein
MTTNDNIMTIFFDSGLPGFSFFMPQCIGDIWLDASPLRRFASRDAPCLRIIIPLEIARGLRIRFEIQLCRDFCGLETIWPNEPRSERSHLYLQQLIGFVPYSSCSNYFRANVGRAEGTSKASCSISGIDPVIYVCEMRSCQVKWSSSHKAHTKPSIKVAPASK